MNKYKISIILFGFISVILGISIIIVPGTPYFEQINIGTFGWYQPISPPDDPIVRWRVVNYGSLLPIEREKPGNIIYQEFSDERPITNITWVQNRFQLAEAKKNYYDYALFLLQEEIYKPNFMDYWGLHPLKEWTLEGSFEVEGIRVSMFKTWYLEKYGYWNQTWWESVVTSGNWKDPIIENWSKYYMYNLIVAWDKLMTRLDKKSAICGGVGTYPKTDGIEIDIGAESAEYVNTKYDLALIYPYPLDSNVPWSTAAGGTIDRLNDDENKIWLPTRQTFKGEMIYIMSPRWKSTDAPWTESFAYEEFSRAAKYAKGIIAFGCTEFVSGTCPNYLPYLVKFKEQYESIQRYNMRIVIQSIFNLFIIGILTIMIIMIVLHYKKAK